MIDRDLLHVMDHETSGLIEQLRDPAREQRIAAAGALAEFDHVLSDSIPALLQALHDVERDVRLSSLTSLRKIWRAVTGPVGELLASNDESDAWFAPLNQALKRLLQDDDQYIRLGAAEGLRDLYCTDAAVFDVFVEAARDPDESLRRRGALALWLGASDKHAPLSQVGTGPGVAALIGLLKDHSKDVRGYALRAVGSLGPKAQAAAPALVEVLQDEDDEVRFSAACALASFGTGASAALPVLVETLTNGDRLKRKAAAFALRSMGPEARAAVPALVIGLKDREKRVRSRCADTLGLIAAELDDDAIHALLETERDEDHEVRSAAQRALAAIGKDHVDAVQTKAAAYRARDSYPLFGFKQEDIPGLIFMLRDRNPDIRAYAATALGHLRTPEAVADLIPLLKDDDEDVRRRAASTLRNIGKAAEPALETAASSDDEVMSEAARVLLQQSRD